jgi:uncharacterized membrane protein
MRIFFIRTLTLEYMIDTAFDQICQSGRANVAILMQLLEKIAAPIKETENEQVRRDLERQVKMIEHKNHGDQPAWDDQQDVHLRYQKIKTKSKS